MTINNILNIATNALREKRILSPELDAEVLLAHAIKKERVFLLAHPEYRLSKKERRLFNKLLKKRLAAMPIAYILGQKEFYKLPFSITPAVLIPRGETESLVEKILEWMKSCKTISSCADVGTGCGCIAISIAKNAPKLKYILASDASSAALRLAKKNAQTHGVSKKIRFKKTSFLRGIRKRFDCIAANLPYLSEKDYADAILSYPEISYEPKMAHLGGVDGLKHIRTLLQTIKKNIHAESWIFLEIGATQGSAVKRIAKTFLPGYCAKILNDHCGFNRIAMIHPISFFSVESE